MIVFRGQTPMHTESARRPISNRCPCSSEADAGNYQSDDPQAAARPETKPTSMSKLANGEAQLPPDKGGQLQHPLYGSRQAELFDMQLFPVLLSPPKLILGLLVHPTFC